MRYARYIILGVVVCGLLAIAVPQYVQMHAVERRKKFQIAELKEMLTAGGPRFRLVRVIHGTAPSVELNGYVRTPEDAAHLRKEMVRRLGDEVGMTHEVGKSAIFNVQVIPPGTRDMRTGEDFWASLEKK